MGLAVKKVRDGDKKGGNNTNEGVEKKWGEGMQMAKNCANIYSLNVRGQGI